jgi:hypothetical protein
VFREFIPAYVLKVHLLHFRVHPRFSGRVRNWFRRSADAQPRFGVGAARRRACAAIASNSAVSAARAAGA